MVDASDFVKKSIDEFIQSGKKVQIFIDGENTDPYCFAASMDALNEEQCAKIEKIVVYYDSKYSVRAWQMLKHYVYGIEIEAVAVKRLVDSKSLVDHKLVAGVAQAVYRELVDSVILVSSDSDFWAVIEDVSARYLVMVEEEKCSYEFKETMRKNGVFYCYLDRFIVSEENNFFKIVFRKELQALLDSSFAEVQVNALQVFKQALVQSRAEISPHEQENLMRRYLKNLSVEIDQDGALHIVVPE